MNSSAHFDDRATITFVCDMLNSFGIKFLVPEAFRLGRLNEPSLPLAQKLLNALYALLVLYLGEFPTVVSSSSQKEILFQATLTEKLDLIRFFFGCWNYPRKVFFTLNSDNTETR
jgi:hypothetical protein